MNSDIVAGNWKQFKGKVQVQWGMLIGDYLGVVTGRRTQLAGERQWAYGAIRSKSLRGSMRTHYPARSFSSNPAGPGNPPPKASVLAIHTHENP